MAVTFTGSTYLSTTSVPASQTIKSSPFTFAIWVNVSSSGGSLIDAGGDAGIYMGVAGSGTSGSQFTDCASIQNSASVGKFFLDLEQGSFTEEQTFEGNSTTTTVWRHYAATWSGSAGAIYENGAAVTPVTGGSLTSSVAWNRIIVGGFNGAASDAWMWNRVLSAAEIAALYNGGRQAGISFTSLVGHWPLLNGGSAGVDFSGNGRNLTNTGTVSDATLQSPRPWGGRSPTIITPASSVITITGTSSTQSSASATVSFAQIIPINATSSTQSSAAATMTIARQITASATTASSASAVNQVSLPISGTATTSSSAAATVGLGFAIAGSGTTASSATAAVSASTTTNITGTASTQSSAAATTSIAYAETAAGQTASSATAAVSFAQVIPITAAATTASSAASSFGALTFPLNATGTTASSAQGAIGSLVSGSATTQSSAAAAFATALFPLLATGTTSSFASATMTSSGGGGGGGSADAGQTGSKRRWLGALGARRRLRR